jgi:hypothetical protein
MSGRRFAYPGMTLVLALALAGGGAVAQLESGDRGISPIDSSNTLEIGGIKVDVTAKDPEAARFAGWRIAQREGFKALWAKTHGRPMSEAPSVPDSTLDGLVSSIMVQSEQIGPTRYMATLGILFDRARSGQLLGVAGQVRQSAPMLLIPILVNGGTMTSLELRNGWQRAWAEFRTSASPIDYVRVSGLGIDPLLVNAAQSRRPGRGWWRNLIDQYGAADVLVAEVQLRRFYPGGPAIATFIARHGPDGLPLGSVTLRAANSAGVPQLMEDGVQRLDAIFTQAQAAGLLTPDPSLLIPEPPAPPELPDETVAAPTEVVKAPPRVIQVAVDGPLSPAATLRGMAGVESVTEIGQAVVVVTYRGSAGALQSALSARGWTVSSDAGGLRVTGAPSAPPAAPAPGPTPPIMVPVPPQSTPSPTPTPPPPPPPPRPRAP